MTEELATTDDAQALAELEQQEAALAAAGKADLASFATTTPRIDVRQGTSKNAPDAANLGDFFNGVTGAVFGKSIEFLVAEAHKGRFLSDKRSPDGKTYGAGNTPVVPDHWPEQYRGKVFAELPEAQETYSRLVNEGQIQWEKGPAIVDSFNFTGFVTAAGDYEVEPFPVRLSIKATNKHARQSASKAGTLLRGLPALWSKALRFESQRFTNQNDEPFYVAVCVGYGETPDLAYRRKAIEAALFAQQVGFVDPETVKHETPGEGGTGDQPIEGDSVVAPRGAGF